MPKFEITRRGTYYETASILAKDREQAIEFADEGTNMVTEWETDYGDIDDTDIDDVEGDEITCSCNQEKGVHCPQCKDYFLQLQKEFPGDYGRPPETEKENPFI